MNFQPQSQPDLESIEVTVIEEHPDGTRIVHVFTSLDGIPEHLAPSFPASGEPPEDPVALAN